MPFCLFVVHSSVTFKGLKPTEGDANFEGDGYAILIYEARAYQICSMYQLNV